MHFDVPKVVRSPGCDHGHDEESRNGRDVKINILEAYVWISKVFRVKSGFYQSTGGYWNPPGVIGPTWSLKEKRRAGQDRLRAPSPVYKGVEEGKGRSSLWRALGESYSLRE